MLKLILFFSKLLILLCDLHILNIEQGDDKVSKYIDPYHFKVWFSTPSPIDFTIGEIETGEIVENTFFSVLLKSGPDIIPKLYMFESTTGGIEYFSYETKKCDNCLVFNYFDRTAPMNPEANCTFKVHEKEFEIQENTNDQYRAEKILNFFWFNVFLKSGKLYLIKHNGRSFDQYDDISKFLKELDGKIFIDVISYEKVGKKENYILCHTEEEIFFFTMIRTFETGITFNMVYSINKIEKDLKYNSITAFAVYDEDVYIAYSHETTVGLVKIKSTPSHEIEKIVFPDKPIDIHDAKFSTISKKIFIIVKNEGLYAYDIEEKTIYLTSHPYLTQFDKVSQSDRSDYEYFGVYLDQGQKDLKEVFIEFVNSADGLLLFNKVFTTNGLKFKPNFIASDEFYYLLFII
jgi:hypothetical protein